VIDSKEPVTHSFEVSIDYWDTRPGVPVLHKARYRFVAASLRGEDRIFDIPATRALDDLNLILLLGARTDNDEQLLLDLSNAYIDRWLGYFEYAICATALGLTVYFVCFNVALVKVLVVNPIAELVSHIRNPGEREKIGKFMTKLRKREYDRQFQRDRWVKKMEKRRQAQNKKKLGKLAEGCKAGQVELAEVRKFQRQMREPKHYPVVYVDEVE
jgi:hypothetical protein